MSENTDLTKEPNTWVKVTRFGGETVQLPFKKGMTVRTAIEQSELGMPKRGEVVTLNADPVSMDRPLDANSVLVITNQVANG